MTKAYLCSLRTIYIWLKCEIEADFAARINPEKYNTEVKCCISSVKKRPSDHRFSVSVNSLTEITYDHRDFSRRERENCDTSSAESTNRVTLYLPKASIAGCL